MVPCICKCANFAGDLLFAAILFIFVAALRIADCLLSDDCAGDLFAVFVNPSRYFNSSQFQPKGLGKFSVFAFALHKRVIHRPIPRFVHFLRAESEARRPREGAV